MRRLAGVALVVALLATGGTVDACSSSGHQAASARPAHVASPAPTPTVPAGCDAALVVVGNVRGALEDAPDQATIRHSSKELMGFGQDSSTDTDLGLDLDHAALDLDRFNLETLLGQPAAADARHFARDLGKITEECTP